MLATLAVRLQSLQVGADRERDTERDRQRQKDRDRQKQRQRETETEIEIERLRDLDRQTNPMIFPAAVQHDFFNEDYNISRCYSYNTH